MRSLPLRHALRSTVAVGAIALSSTAAKAACTTANGVVTCTGPSTTDEVNAAFGRTPPPSVSLLVTQGATVTRGFNSTIIPNNPPFTGAISYTNSGVVGTSAANVDFLYVGTAANSGNSFSLDVRGTQNGAIITNNVGGSIVASNSGTITRGLVLRGAGPISFVNTGAVFNSSFFTSEPAITLISSRTTVENMPGSSRETVTGGAITATIGGMVGVPATGSLPFRAQDVTARSVGGVDITVTGTAGFVTADTRGENRTSQSTFATSGGTSTNNSVTSVRTIGTDARVTVEPTGRIAGASITTGPGAASLILNGLLDTGADTVNRSIGVAAFGSDTNTTSTDVFSGPSSSDRSSMQTRVSTGGAALVDIGATGRLVGSRSGGIFLDISSNAGPATLRVAGQLGSTLSSTTIVSSSGFNETTQSRTIMRADGTSASTSSRTLTSSGSAASASVAASGVVTGTLIVRGDASAAIDNAGRIAGDASAVIREQANTSSSQAASRTITTNAAGVRDQVDTRTNRDVSESVGGTASLINRVGASIGGSVMIDGGRSATFENAGTVANDVSLNAFAGRATLERNVVTTNSRAPATGGGTVVTNTEEETRTQAFRTLGGTATGNYGGTIGSARPPSGVASNVTQDAALTSTATVTGTIFGNFSGNAGSENGDSTFTSTMRQVIQPSGAFTRETSNTSRNTSTQNASTSTLTVASTGSILPTSLGGGNVEVTSLGGNAVFTLDGGRVGGDILVAGGAGSDTTETSSSSFTATRAAPTATNRFPQEVTQNEQGSSFTEERQAVGTAIVRVNSGTVGGNLFAEGTGRGAGTLGVDVLIGGTVTGNVTASALGENSTERSSSTATRTAPNVLTRTSTDTTTTTASANNGGVLVAVNGTVGGRILAEAASGPATVNLTGRAGTIANGGVSVFAFGFNESSEVEQVSTSNSPFLGETLTARRTTTTSVPTGGVATLNIDAGAALRAAGASSVEGDVVVQGLAGSVLNVAAGSRIVQNTGRVIVGGSAGDVASTMTNTFSGGVQTGFTTVTNNRVVGGPAVLTNAGTIGSLSNAPGVSVASVGGTSVNNSGTINGTVTASARSFNLATTTVATNLNVAANRRIETTRVATAVGGAASVANSGLVTGGVLAVGSTGAVTNSGVVRGGVTLGAGFSNFSTTSTTTGTGVTARTVISPPVVNPTLFTQTYTLNQNGLLIGGVNVTGATTVDPSGATIRTSNVNATLNFNDGSITLGNITAADTNTNVNLNGSGFLGIPALDGTRPPAGQAATGFAQTPSFARFSAIDPTLGTGITLASGVRISGVQTLTKSSDGTFVIVGAPGSPASGTTPASFTLDVGTLRVNGGELQLGLANPAGQPFSIRGNVENNASLVVGQRIVNGAQSAIQGINLSVLGNVTNAAAGNLVVGFNPSFVQSGSALVPFGPGSPGLASTNSFVRVDGNLNLAGNVAVQGISGALYEAGRAQDLFSVSGSYTNTGTVRSNFASPFVGFTLTPRSEGGRTIVSLGVVRTAFDTVTTDDNARAAAGAFQAALPSIFGGIRSGANAADTQDLARIVTLLDTQLTADQANQVFRELSSGEFYGSLSAVSTTIPFGEATDGLTSSGKSGIGLWIRPTGQFAKYKDDLVSGASEIDVTNYGGSIGLNYSTDAGGSFGIAGGYGKLDVDATSPESARADTIMVGLYAAQRFGGLHLSGQAVYGKTEWDVSRTLSLLGRRATASFDSEEIRASARIAYTIAPLPGLDISPFARVEARRYDFDGFTESGAGAVSLVVAGRSKTIVSPEVGLRMAGAVGEVFRPFAEASYVFNGDVGSDRRMGFAGNRVQDFTTRGVDPDRSIKGSIGVVADVAFGTAFVRGDYASGGRQQVGSVRGGLLFAF